MSIGQILARWGAAFVLTAAVVDAAIFGTSHAAGVEVPAAYALAWSLMASAGLTAFWGLLRAQHLAPIRRLTAAARQMSAGQWQTRVEPGGDDDLRQLASALNLLAGQVQRQLETLQQERGDLRALVDTLPDPILLADAQGRLIMANAPAADLLRVAPVAAQRQKLVNVMADEQMVALFEAASAASATRPLHREIRTVRGGQRVIYQGVATGTEAGGVLVVLRDITTLAQTIQMKTDFVANASHELRTPIAAIKIAFETLGEVWHDDPTQTQKCLTVMEGQLQRLQDMAQDLLDLSGVERVDFQPPTSRIDTAQPIALLRSTLGPMARQKGVELVLPPEGQEDPPELQTDPRLLNLVLKNLMENAIKFTPAGGRVELAIAREAGGNVVFRVIDTGIGIAPEHIDRVFERFYQVDAARSGTAGRGTGLGLAIVKHAMAALGGSVKLESKPGSGTTVTCLLPQPPAEAGAA